MLTELLLGLLAGSASAFLGIGCGVLLIPLFHVLFDVQTHIIIGTSLLITVFTTFSGAVTYVRKGAYDMRIFLATGPAGAVCSLLGAYVSGFVEAKTLIYLLIALLFAAAAVGKPEKVVRIPLVILGLLSAVFGFLAGLLGVGGGFLLVPLLLFAHVPSHRAVGTSLMALTFFSGAGALMHTYMGRVSWQLFVPTLLGTIIGSQIVSRWAVSIPEKMHYLGIRILLPCMGLVLLLTELLL